MKKALLLFISIVGCFPASAQFWNKPEAQYRFDWNVLTFFGYSTGYRQFSIGSDTVIDGIQFSRYNELAVTYNDDGSPFSFSNFDTTMVENAIAFGEADSMVFCINVLDQDGGIDTLYDFGAQPGDSWTWEQVPYGDTETSYMCDSVITVTVLETGQTMVQGVPLQYLLVQYQGLQVWTPLGQILQVDTIFERFGSKWLSFMSIPDYCNRNSPINDSGSPYMFKCYSDNEFALGSNCDIIEGYTAIDEAISMELGVFPNPTSSAITLQSQSPLSEAWLTDLAGRRLLPLQPNGTQWHADLGALPTGMYLIEALSEDGKRGVSKVVKE